LVLTSGGLSRLAQVGYKFFQPLTLRIMNVVLFAVQDSIDAGLLDAAFAGNAAL
jgi:hypothetical protein